MTDVNKLLKQRAEVLDRMRADRAELQTLNGKARDAEDLQAGLRKTAVENGQVELAQIDGKIARIEAADAETSLRATIEKIVADGATPQLALKVQNCLDTLRMHGRSGASGTAARMKIQRLMNPAGNLTKTRDEWSQFLFWITPHKAA